MHAIVTFTPSKAHPEVKIRRRCGYPWPVGDTRVTVTAAPKPFNPEIGHLEEITPAQCRELLADAAYFGVRLAKGDGDEGALEAALCAVESRPRIGAPYMAIGDGARSGGTIGTPWRPDMPPKNTDNATAPSGGTEER